MRALATPIKVLADGVSKAGNWMHVKVENPSMLSQLLKECSAANMKVIIGDPREVGVPSSDSGEIVFVDLRSLSNVREHCLPDQVISVGTGMAIAELDAMLGHNRQWWPVAAPPNSTIHDVIVSGDGGPLEHGYGGPRHLTLGLDVNLANGTCIKTGGKVVKNVTGYDMTKLIVGSRGIFGVPSLAHLRLYAKPESCRSLVVASETGMLGLLNLANKFMLSGLPIAVLELVESASLSAILPLGAAAGTSQKFFMLCQIYEHEQVIMETLPQLQAMQTSGFWSFTFEQELSGQLLKAVSDMPTPFMEIDCAPSVMALLWQEVSQISLAERVRVRPGAGRMRLSCDEKTFSEVRASLSRWCEKKSMSFSVAWIDRDRVIASEVPQGNAAASNIITKIKQQFDPSGCLSPFASLY